jgi:hypothetical protein
MYIILQNQKFVSFPLFRNILSTPENRSYTRREIKKGYEFLHNPFEL